MRATIIEKKKKLSPLSDIDIDDFFESLEWRDLVLGESDE